MASPSHLKVFSLIGRIFHILCIGGRGRKTRIAWENLPILCLLLRNRKIASFSILYCRDIKLQMNFLLIYIFLFCRPCYDSNRCQILLIEEQLMIILAGDGGIFPKLTDRIRLLYVLKDGAFSNWRCSTD